MKSLKKKKNFTNTKLSTIKEVGLEAAILQYRTVVKYFKQCYMKKCKMCEKEQPITNFYKINGKKHKDSWNCRDSYCATCRAEITHKRIFKT